MSRLDYDLQSAQKIVIKVGSALITNNGLGANVKMINYLAKASHQLMLQGKQVVLVSSGAIAQGMAELQLAQKPLDVHIQQSLAAIGQMRLMQFYQQGFAVYQRKAAQILLTHEDRQHYRRFYNASCTLKHLLDLQVTPVVNENDSVADDEIRFGDNDTLAGFASNLIGADLMIILTDQQGLYTANPRTDSKADFVCEMLADDPRLLNMATTEGGVLGSGGMYTKILAARQASLGGTHTIIAKGSQSKVLEKLFQQSIRFTFLRSQNPKQTVQQLFHGKGQSKA